MHVDSHGGTLNGRRRGGVSPLALLQAAVLGAGLSACGSSAPITVLPTLASADFAAVSCPATAARFSVGAVQDKRGNADPRNIGFTQTGAFNVKASLLAEPAPADLLRGTLTALLARCGNLADDGKEKYLLQPSLLRLQLTEVTGMFSERITAILKYETLIVDAGSLQRAGRITVTGEAHESSGIDTSDYAAQVVQESLRQSLGDFSHQLRQYQ